MNKTDKKPLNYMAIDKDGRFVAVITGTVPPKDIAKEVGKWIRQGFSVERCDSDYVRRFFGDIVNISRAETSKCEGIDNG